MSTIGFVDESIKLGHYECYGLAIIERDLIDIVWRDLISAYDRILRSYGGRYGYSEAKFSLLLRDLSDLGVPLDRNVLRSVINSIISTLGGKVRFRALVVPRGLEFFSPFADIPNYVRECWFLRAYRSRIGKKAAFPASPVIRMLEVLDFLLRPYIVELGEICLDRNLGSLGVKIRQPSVCIEILYRIRVRICDSQRDRGVQVADFVAGAAIHIAANCRGWLSRGGTTTLFSLQL